MTVNCSYAIYAIKVLQREKVRLYEMSRKRILRGIVGIEVAIVSIALAFVALSMGFYTTQRSKGDRDTRTSSS